MTSERSESDLARLSAAVLVAGSQAQALGLPRPLDLAGTGLELAGCLLHHCRLLDHLRRRRHWRIEVVDPSALLLQLRQRLAHRCPCRFDLASGLGELGLRRLPLGLDRSDALLGVTQLLFQSGANRRIGLRRRDGAWHSRCRVEQLVGGHAPSQPVLETDQSLDTLVLVATAELERGLDRASLALEIGDPIDPTLVLAGRLVGELLGDAPVGVVALAHLVGSGRGGAQHLGLGAQVVDELAQLVGRGRRAVVARIRPRRAGRGGVGPRRLVCRCRGRRRAGERSERRRA
jgi:hypothetical protein